MAEATAYVRPAAAVEGLLAEVLPIHQEEEVHLVHPEVQVHSAQEHTGHQAV